jgi:tRNA A37 threonylcarbamoyladenosine synthetase subunit TsaC/SUA5/YrdC
MTAGPDPVIVGTESLDLAIAALRGGAVVAVPTDTVYGLAADLSRPLAVEKLFALKERPTEVPVPVLVAGSEQVAASSPGVERLWPTWVARPRPGRRLGCDGPTIR